jgi:hypothetical protein
MSVPGFLLLKQPLPASRQDLQGLLPASQRGARAIVILCDERRQTMRAYVAVAGMALGLVGVWAALVPFVA